MTLCLTSVATCTVLPFLALLFAAPAAILCYLQKPILKPLVYLRLENAGPMSRDDRGFRDAPLPARWSVNVWLTKYINYI